MSFTSIFGTVEGASAAICCTDVHCELMVSARRGRGAMPVFGLAGVYLRCAGSQSAELDFELSTPPIVMTAKAKSTASIDFGFNLRGICRNVRVVLSVSADAEQAAETPRRS